MTEGNTTDFLFLNREGRWKGFHWDGLEIDETGRLILRRLPRQTDRATDDLSALEAPQSAAGVAVDRDGTLYVSVPSERGVFRSGGCTVDVERLPCTRPSAAFTSIAAPAGLWLGTQRRRVLYVADVKRNQILLLDPDDSRVVESWSGPFEAPTALTGDAAGNLYIVDAGHHRMVKVNSRGEVDAAFAGNIEQAGIGDPIDVAVDHSDRRRLFVLDGVAHEVAVLNADGTPAGDTSGKPIRFGGDRLRRPLGIAAAGGTVYVGDNDARRVFVFRQAGDGYPFIGEAVDYRGPVAGLALDTAGGLIVHTGAALAPTRLTAGAGHIHRGVLWSDAVVPRTMKVAWHRLSSTLELGADTHVQFFYAPAAAGAPPPAAPSLVSTGSPFADPRWRPVAPDVDDFFIGGEPAAAIFIGALLTGDGSTTPALAQLRIEYDHESYAAYLPALYRRPGPAGDMLVRLLSLFESFFNEPEWAIDRLPRLFDPHAAPDDVLAWLASWLDLPLDERWTAERKRRAIADAFRRYAWRGTPDQLRDALQDRLGLDVTIVEPSQTASCWALPASVSSCTASPDVEPLLMSTRLSVLGTTTMLAPASPQGAVVGTTAVLDRSSLIDGSDYGDPLFSDLAFQFAVLVHRGQLRADGALNRLRAAIDDEKPVHTSYHVCVIEPRMRVGFQARVGIDTVVGGGPPALRADGASPLDGTAALGGQPAGRLGQQSQIGIDTRLG